MSLSMLATKVQFALAAPPALPNPGPGGLPANMNAQAGYLIGLLETGAGVAGIIAVIIGFVYMIFGIGGHGGNGLSKVGMAFGGVVGALCSASLVGGLFAVTG